MKACPFWFHVAVARRLRFKARLVLGAALLCVGVSVQAADDEPGNGAQKAADEPEVVSADSLVVEVQEGAASPQAAIAAFAAASSGGDVEAALALIDPQVRPLLLAEVLLEEYMLEQHLLRNQLMTEEERKSPFNNLGAFPIVYAMRDLLRTKTIDVVNEPSTNASGDRVLIDVDWTAYSWHPVSRDDRFTNLKVTMLAVRREDRWYLFHPFGSHYVSLLGSDLGIRDGESVMRGEQVDRPDATGKTLVLTYLVPVESIHEEFVKAAQSPETIELLDQVQKLVRFNDAVRERAKRGDFRDLKELDQALTSGRAVFERLVQQLLLRLRTVADESARQLPPKPDSE